MPGKFSGLCPALEKQLLKYISAIHVLGDNLKSDIPFINAQQ
jgi:hypothetical protein